jgi:hypothetical protein
VIVSGWHDLFLIMYNSLFWRMICFGATKFKLRVLWFFLLWLFILDSLGQAESKSFLTRVNPILLQKLSALSPVKRMKLLQPIENVKHNRAKVPWRYNEIQTISAE